MEQFYEETKQKFNMMKMFDTKKIEREMKFVENKKSLPFEKKEKVLEKKIEKIDSIPFEKEYFVSLHENSFFLFLYIYFQYPESIEKVYISRNEMEEIEKKKPFYFQYMKTLLFELKKKISVSWIPDEHTIKEFSFHEIMDRLKFSLKWNSSFFDFLQISLFEKESIDFILLYPNMDEKIDLQQFSFSKKYIFLPQQPKNSIFHFMKKNYDIFETSIYMDYRDYLHTNYKQFLEYEINLFYSCEKIIGYKRKEEIVSFFHFFFMEKWN